MSIIELRNICKHYGEGSARQEVLKSASIALQPGELVALSGPSGSGKTTLLNIAGLLDQADSGEVLLKGAAMSSDSKQLARARRQDIGFIFQHFNLVPVMTAQQNVEYPLTLLGLPKAEVREKTDAILAKVGMWEFRHKRPDLLSGGQKQRIAIARAMVKKPALVIADEPSASLDTENTLQVIEMMKSIASETGTGFLMATHDDRLTQRCDRVIEMHDGELTREIHPHHTNASLSEANQPSVAEA